MNGKLLAVYIKVMVCNMSSYLSAIIYIINTSNHNQFSILYDDHSAYVVIELFSQLLYDGTLLFMALT